MTLKNRLKDPDALMRIGMACLWLGSLSHWFLHPTTHYGQSLVDGVFGVLFGVSIGSLLLSLRLSGRRCSGD